MKNKHHLGIYIFNQTISLIEFDRQKIVSTLDTPQSLLQSDPAGNSNDIKLTAIIQKFLRDKKIDAPFAYLAFSNQDIVLRSFLMPWMTQSEMHTALVFEARRYIPFKIEDLNYNYQTVTIAKDKSRKIEVLFAGVKKDLIERYSSILNQAGLTVVYAEPSILSALRLLIFKKQVQKNQRTVLVFLKQNHGTISIIDQGIPKFIRDFSLLQEHDFAQLHSNIVSESITREIRISLDFIRRQKLFSEQIHRICLLSQFSSQNLAEPIGKEFNIPITTHTLRSLTNSDHDVDFDYLYAYGAGLKSYFSSTINLDLSRALEEIPRVDKQQPAINENFSFSLKLGLICACLVGLVFLFSKNSMAVYEKKLVDLKKKEGVYSSFSIPDLDKKRDEVVNKLQGYKDVRFKSQMAFFLSRIPQKLPEGTWLSSLSIKYEDVKLQTKIQNKKDIDKAKPPETKTVISIDLSGFAYSSNANQQIGLINRFVANLKDDDILLKVFNDINLKNAIKQTSDDLTVTAFQVSLKNNDQLKRP